MTALVVSEVFPPQTGGSGRWLYELYRRMPSGCAGVAAGEYPGAEAFDAEQELAIERMGLKFPTWGCFSGAGVGHYWRAFRQLEERVRRERFGILHCGKCLPEGWLGWLMKLRRGVPYVVFVHGEELRVAAASRELTWMTRRVLRGARTIVVNSHNTARILADEWRVTDRVEVLHPGVDAERFAPAERDGEVRRRLGWDGRPVVLTVGRLQKRKGQDMLIRALPAIRQQVPEVLYTIVGDGEERANLERLVDELELRSHVRFHGEPRDEELVECYQQCDLFALPNREVDGDFEGFGMVLVEAQACGKPVIAGDSGGTAETLVRGETGLVVDCREPAGVASAVSELLADRSRLEAMGQAARHWAMTSFDWPALCRRGEKLLKLAPTANVMPRAAAGAAR